MKHKVTPRVVNLETSLGLLSIAVTFGCLITAASPAHLGAQAAMASRMRSASLVQTFGEGDKADDAYVLSSIRSVRASASGGIYVLDAKESDVKLFSAAGRYVRSIGRHGSGPGELTGPSFRLELTEREVVVADNMLRRSVHFSLDGAHLRTVNFRSQNERDVPQNTRSVRADWTVSISMPSIVRGNSDLFWRLTLYGPKGRSDSLGAIRSDMVDVTVHYSVGGHQALSFQSTTLGHGGAYAFYNDTLLAIADGYTGTVRWIGFTSNGAQIRRLEQLAAARGAPSLSDFDSIKKSLEQQWKRFDPSPSVTLTNPPPGYSVAAEALFAADGALWIAAPATKNSTRWTVFPVRGDGFVVALPSSFTLTDVRGDRLFGHGRGPDDLPLVLVYELAR